MNINDIFDTPVTELIDKYSKQNGCNIRLLDYQTAHCEKIKNALLKYSRALDCSDTGTGKTYVTIKACLDLGLIPWVISPKSVVTSWKRTLTSAGIDNPFVISYGQLCSNRKIINIIHTNEDNNAQVQYDWLLNADTEFIQKSLLDKYVFIFDEAHKCKNTRTILSQILLSLSKYPVKILLLSATIIDKLEHFIPLGYVLKLYPSLEDGLKWVNKNDIRRNPMLSIHEYVFREHASRMKIDDAGNMFRNNIVHFKGIQMNNYWDIEKKYDEINRLLKEKEREKELKKMTMAKMKIDKKEKEKRDGKAKAKTKKSSVLNSTSTNTSVGTANTTATASINEKIGEMIDDEDEEESEIDYEQLEHEILFVKEEVKENKKKSNRNNSFAKIIALRQEIEAVRIESIIDMTFSLLKEGKSVVIFVNFIKTIMELSEKLNCNCLIWGQQTLSERSNAIDAFCSDESRIIICNIQSGSAGISLHDTNGKYPRVSIISPTWSAQDLIQSLGRIHRAMGKTDCEQHIIFCRNTIEERVGEIIKHKINNIKTFNNGTTLGKKDNFEVFLKTEVLEKKKKQEREMMIYKTVDLDSIYGRINEMESFYDKLSKDLVNLKSGTNEHSECNFRLEKVSKQLDFHRAKLKEMIDGMV